MPADIPFEIQEEIIKRLPIKSLIRFISVSKPWKSLISSPKFILAYENRPRHHHHHDRLLVKYKGNSGVECISIDNDDSFPQHKFRVTIPESVSILAQGTTRIVGSSYGLICFFSTTKSTAIIWNPTVNRTVDDIVVPNVLENKTIFGFGVCPSTLDPKLVKITFIHNTPYNIVPWQVEVFTLSSNAWRSLSINLLRKTSVLVPNQVFIDGIIYWLATEWMIVDTEFRWNNSIISFDITTEEFKEINLPDSLLHSAGVFSISKLRESLVVIEAYEWRLGVWKMDHGGVTETFTKLFNIYTPIGSRLYNVHGFRNNGQPIIEFRAHVRKKGFYVYEHSSGDMNFTEIYGEIEGVSSYMETLLLLDR